MATVVELSLEELANQAAIALPSPRWVLQANCAQIDPAEIDALFYPSDGLIPDETADLCAACPVREECLATAIAARYPEGIWGGIDMSQVFGRTARAARSRASRQ